MIPGAILLACLGWAITFGVPWGDFWIKMGCTVLVVSGYSLRWKRPQVAGGWGSVGLGVVSAAVLYAVFYVGNAIGPLIVAGAHERVDRIYGLGQGTPQWAVFLLLLLVTGPGEEIFWRGFLQDALARRLGPLVGFSAATLLYGGVHLFSGNPMLTLAALVAGAFWGALYAWKKDLLALIVSHSLWSAVVFTVRPIR